MTDKAVYCIEVEKSENDRLIYRVEADRVKCGKWIVFSCNDREVCRFRASRVVFIKAGEIPEPEARVGISGKVTILRGTV